MEFSTVTVLCVGDLMLDRFTYADMERISPEAPVPVLRLKHSSEMLGGAGNVAANVASLGGRAVLVGMLGQDGAGDSLRRILQTTRGVTADCVGTAERATICKTRFIAGHQQVVRADDESLHPLSAGEATALLATVRKWMPQVGAIVLSDYGKGTLTPHVVADVVAAARSSGVPVFVDPKSSDFAVYRGATCITPNARELAAAAAAPADSEAAIEAAARRLLAVSDAAAILVTRSEKGMLLVEANGGAHAAPARARQVFDVSGAGDTVIATMALCHAAGRSLPQAMHIANAAASVVVSKLGTATADMTEVMHELDAQDHERGIAPVPGAQPVEHVRALVRRWQQQGLRVGFTNGCFDVLHPGHVALLARARSECDRLVVALNDDASVRRLKGPARPVNTIDARALVIAAIRTVDCVVAFADDTPLELIRTLRPDVLVKGADYTVDQVVGADIVLAAGGRVVLATLMSGQSTTSTLERIQTLQAAL